MSEIEVVTFTRKPSPTMQAVRWDGTEENLKKIEDWVLSHDDVRSFEVTSEYTDDMGKRRLQIMIKTRFFDAMMVITAGYWLTHTGGVHFETVPDNVLRRSYVEWPEPI